MVKSDLESTASEAAFLGTSHFIFFEEVFFGTRLERRHHVNHFVKYQVEYLVMSLGELKAVKYQA